MPYLVVMKHLTTLLTLLLSCSMHAQGPVEFPWNPDADGDDFIGVNDLMALLGEFDSVFSEEALYLSEDSLSAMYEVGGPINFIQCQLACNNLPGRWKMPQLNEILFVADNFMWLETQPGGMKIVNNQLQPTYLSPNGSIWQVDASQVRHCFCVTKERPKVEYSYCSVPSDGNNVVGVQQFVDDFQACCDAKVQEGWYPLGGMARGAVEDQSQAFWRWAE